MGHLRILAIALLLSIGQSFIVETSLGYHKCFFSDISHDKTLDVRFGVPRHERSNCKFRLTIEHMADVETGEVKAELHRSEHACHEMSPRQPFVYKHTPSEQEYTGSYRICVANIEDYNQRTNSTLFELQIIEKYDPALMVDLHSTPLVESAELVQLEQEITTIKRTLSWCQQHIAEVDKLGASVAKTLQDASYFSHNATYFQILFLVFFGVAWVLAVRSLGK